MKSFQDIDTHANRERSANRYSGGAGLLLWGRGGGYTPLDGDELSRNIRQGTCSYIYECVRDCVLFICQD
jgi:hypothetical protein